MPELAEYAAKRREYRPRTRISVEHPAAKTRAWDDPTASFLPSDSDSDLERPVRRRRRGKAAADWNALMRDIVPDHLPPQPPRHCWKFTPVYATQMLSELPALQLVNRKLDNARLVESSLRKLIRDTDTAALPPEDKTSKKFVDGFIEEVAPDGAALPGAEEQGRPQEAQADAVQAVTPMAVDVSTEMQNAQDAQSDQSDTQEDTPPTVRAGERRVLPRVVNYKSSWYSTTATSGSGLPNTNLYTAKLRGGGGDGRRPRRYYIE